MIDKPDWSALLRAVPDEPLYSEVGRRNGLRSGGRPKVLRKCKKCGAELGAREMKAHKCKGRVKNGT